MKFEKTFFVGVQAVDQNREITNEALVEMLSDITMLHGFQIGHTAAEGVSPVSWIVLNWKLEIYKRVRMFSTVRVVTWIQKYSKIRANRDYIIYSEDGGMIAKATAVWVARKGDSTVFCRLTPELMDPFGPEPENVNYPENRFMNFMDFEAEVTDTKTVVILPSMKDYNGHVHNSEYLDMAELILPETIYYKPVLNLEIYYKQEIQTEKEVLLEYSIENNDHVVAVRRIDDRLLHALVVLHGE